MHSTAQHSTIVNTIAASQTAGQESKPMIFPKTGRNQLLTCSDMLKRLLGQ